MAAKKKKMAAALAAITLYLQEEEAAALEKIHAQDDLLDASCSPWRQSGRQDMMAMRRLVQLRAFTRF